MSGSSNRPSKRKAFVTGATGFVGINLCRALLDAGWQVTALHRQGSNIRYLEKLDIDLVVGDITDAASVMKAMPEGLDAVFHVAGDTNLWSANNARQTRINVDGTQNVLAAARTKSVKRFIHTSTISAIGRHEQPVDESTVSNAPQSIINYERSKFAAEEAVRTAIEDGMDAVILRPGAIMGPFDAGTWASVFFQLRDGKLAALPPGSVPLNHVDEIVAAHLTAFDRAPPGSLYLLGGEQVAFADLFRKMARAMGIKPPGLVAPRPVLKLFGFLLAGVARFTGKEPDVTPEAAAFLGHDNRADSSKAQSELGYQLCEVDRCVQDSYDWLKQENLL